MSYYCIAKLVGPGLAGASRWMLRLGCRMHEGMRVATPSISRASSLCPNSTQACQTSYVMLRMAWIRVVLGVSLIGFVNVALAQDDQSPQGTAESVGESTNATKTNKAIESFVKAYVDAFNAGDASKLGTYWSANGVFVDASTGETVSGRSAIELSLRETFAENPGLKLACITASIESPSPNVAIETGEAVVTRTDDTVSRSSYQVVYIKKDRKWLIDCVTDNFDMPSTEPAASEATEPLAELEWLIGQWIDANGESTIELSCNWTGGKKFLSRRYSVVSGDELITSGLQLIGWDAREKKIRSWLFDEDGTVVIGEWNKHEDGWRIQSVATLGDGRQGSSTTILTPVDANSYRVEKVNQLVAGEILPNMEAVLVVRQ